MRKIDLQTIDTKILIINVYLTQIISLGIGVILYYILYRQNPLKALYLFLPNDFMMTFFYSLAFTLVVVFLNIFLEKKLPKKWLDDGGINEKLFQDLPIWHIGLIAIVVGFVEEFLFRGVIQSSLGVLLTSLLFSVIHFRYLSKPVLILFTFSISVGLGYLTIYLGLFAAFIAHAMIDFILGVLISKRILSS